MSRQKDIYSTLTRQKDIYSFPKNEFYPPKGHLLYIDPPKGHLLSLTRQKDIYSTLTRQKDIYWCPKKRTSAREQERRRHSRASRAVARTRIGGALSWGAAGRPMSRRRRSASPSTISSTGPGHIASMSQPRSGWPPLGRRATLSRTWGGGSSNGRGRSARRWPG